jgi:ADP-ribose pyrophosphatase YjhB (NUDIX family)
MMGSWLDLAREIFSLAQAGLTYSTNEYDLQRYQRLREISAEIIAGHSRLDKRVVLEILASQVGYATPKVDVRAVVFRDGKLLLVQERSDGCWTMPGGWADVGEAPSIAAKREVLEESGFEVQVDSLAAILDANHVPGAPMELFHAYKLLFMCSILRGEARTSYETPAVDFFSPDHLPPLSPFRTIQRMIQEAFARLENPSLPTVFD